MSHAQGTGRKREKKNLLKPQRNANPRQSPGERRARAALGLLGVWVWPMPPQNGHFGAQRCPGQGDSQVRGVALGFPSLSRSGGHCPSTLHWRSGCGHGPGPMGAMEGCGGQQGCARCPPPCPRSSPSPSPGSDASFGCLPPISSSVSGPRHKAEIFLPGSVRTKHTQTQQRSKNPHLHPGFFCTKPPCA